MAQFTIAGRDGEILVVNRWDASAPVKAVVQIAHGAAEHLGRYDRLARFLADRNYTVIGADHRGHGANAELNGLGDFGPGGFAGIVDDMARITELAREQVRGAPVILLAHSFGSFAAQVYLLKNAHFIDGLVLSGTADVELLLTGADLESGMTAANALFEPARTQFDWLSRDDDEVDAYIADPLCGFELQAHSLATMPQVVAQTMHIDAVRAAAVTNLPIYIISGEHDPIVGPEQSLSRTLADRYLEAGFTDVSHRIYPAGRHEMFNETNRDQVMEELAQWLDDRIGSAISN